MTERPGVTGAEIDSAPAFRYSPFTQFNELHSGKLPHTKVTIIYTGYFIHSHCNCQPRAWLGTYSGQESMSWM